MRNVIMNVPDIEGRITLDDTIKIIELSRVFVLFFFCEH